MLVGFPSAGVRGIHLRMIQTQASNSTVGSLHSWTHNVYPECFYLIYSPSVAGICYVSPLIIVTFMGYTYIMAFLLNFLS